jgi:DNA mismatch endonuclease (patch repair protein)
MRANRRKDTGPERQVRGLLHARGLRYRVDLPIKLGSPRPIRPDIVFTRARLAIFIDGCFWHGCPDHKGRPRTNAHYWGPKLDGNAARDRQQTDALNEAGWLVLRFWEHEDPLTVARAIVTAYQQRLPGATAADEV